MRVRHNYFPCANRQARIHHLISHHEEMIEMLVNTDDASLISLHKLYHHKSALPDRTTIYDFPPEQEDSVSIQ